MNVILQEIKTMFEQYHRPEIMEKINGTFEVWRQAHATMNGLEESGKFTKDDFTTLQTIVLDTVGVHCLGQVASFMRKWMTLKTCWRSFAPTASYHFFDWSSYIRNTLSVWRWNRKKVPLQQKKISMKKEVRKEEMISRRFISTKLWRSFDRLSLDAEWWAYHKKLHGGSGSYPTLPQSRWTDGQNTRLQNQANEDQVHQSSKQYLLEYWELDS